MKIDTPSLNLGPLTHCNLDDANYMLRTGRASRQDAENYVAAWNRPGHRLTVARLEEHLVSVNGVGLLSPVIKIS